MTITTPQLKRLQVLYTQFERHSLDCPGPSREARMRWASEALGRPVASFKDLQLAEAIRLIDGLQQALGTKVPSKSPRRKQTRHDGEKKGTEGRHDQLHAESTLVGPEDLRRIQRDLDELSWDQARLQAFLASPRGPNNHSTSIRTLGDANRVHWALKRIRSRSLKQTSTPQPEIHAS